jgi:hypothetical protein
VKPLGVEHGDVERLDGQRTRAHLLGEPIAVVAIDVDRHLFGAAIQKEEDRMPVPLSP